MYTAAVLGLGNIGRCAIESLEIAPDFECLGVIRRAASLGKNPNDLRGVPDFASMEDLIKAKGRPDVVLLATPSRNVPKDAEGFLKQGFCVIDSFDIHEEIAPLVKDLDAFSKDGKAVAVTAVGWDPGTDSVMRALFEAMVPVGTTFTNFGRGRSMGHSVAARSHAGVADATSITIPVGGGRHARLVYVVLEGGATLEAVSASLKADPYFASDPLEVKAVSQEEMAFVADDSHGLLMERLGASGLRSNQRLSFDMRIDNPALTSQIMVSYARAAVRLAQRGLFGAYTSIDIAPVDLLPGDRFDHIKRLV